MNKENLIRLFQHESQVPADIIAEIVTHFKEKEIAKNQFHLVAGKVCDEYLLLEKGYMRSFAYDTEGNEVTTKFCGPGEMVFEVSSFFNRTRSMENIQALTNCEGWYITYQQLNMLFHALPAFREFGRSVLVKGYSELKTRMLQMITAPAEERYAQLLNTNPDIFQHAPLKHIASYLGITDTSLSRIRKELSKK